MNCISLLRISAFRICICEKAMILSYCIGIYAKRRLPSSEWVVLDGAALFEVGILYAAYKCCV